jgi:hypothetical protein
MAWWWRLADAVKAVEQAPQFSDIARARREREDGSSARFLLLQPARERDGTDGRKGAPDSKGPRARDSRRGPRRTQMEMGREAGESAQNQVCFIFFFFFISFYVFYFSNFDFKFKFNHGFGK